MDIGRCEAAGCARVCVGHPDHDAFLEAQHIANIGLCPQRFHDGEFGRSGITEQIFDALGGEQVYKGCVTGGNRE